MRSVSMMRLQAAMMLCFVGAPAAGAQELLWEARPGFTGFGAIAVSGGIVVTGNITANKGTVGIDAQTGKLLWRLPGKMYNGPASDGRYAYTVQFVTDVNHRLSALDLKSGRTAWSVEGPGFGSKAELLGDGGRVYLVGEDGKARAFDAATGRLLWTFPYSPGRGFCPTSPAADSGVVYFGGGREPRDFAGDLPLGRGRRHRKGDLALGGQAGELFEDRRVRGEAGRGGGGGGGDGLQHPLRVGRQDWRGPVEEGCAEDLGRTGAAASVVCADQFVAKVRR